MTKIKVAVNDAGRGSVWIEGREVPNVLSLSINIDAGEPPKATIVVMGDVEVDADVKPDMLDLIRQFSS